MIRFNDNFNPNPDDDLAKKLQKILDQIGLMLFLKTV